MLNDVAPVNSVNNLTGDVTITINDLLPTQTGQGGKYLKTDGANVSWETPTGSGAVDSVNSLTGAVVLTTANIADSLNARYVTDAQLALIQDYTYTLPTATGSILGGIKIGSRLTITDGVLSADVQTTDISGKASTALSNLASVAINTSLLFDTDSAYDIGSTTHYVANLFSDKIYLNSTASLDGSVAGKISIVGSLTTLSNANLSLVPNGTGYTIIGDAGTSSHSFNTNDDLLVSGKLEVDGICYLDDDLWMTTSTGGNILLRFRENTLSGMVVGADFNADQALWGVHSVSGVQLILTIKDYIDLARDFDHAPQTNPTLYIQSVTDPDTNNTQWLSLTHDQTNGVIAVGTGVLTVPSLALGANSITMTGSLGATGARLTKGWFTDLEITNLPTINGGTLATALNLSGTNTGDQTLNGLLPTQTGNGGKYLKTDGSNASWDTPAGSGGTVKVDVIREMPPATLFATLDTMVGTSTPAESIPVYDFDDTTVEYMDYLCRLPSDYSGGGVSFTVSYGAAATSGNGGWSIGIRRIPEDAEDLDTTAHTYDYNDSAADTVPSASGELQSVTITFSDGADMDNWAANELAIVRIKRNTSITGNATGDLHLVELFGAET